MNDLIFEGPVFHTPDGDARAIQVSADGIIRKIYLATDPLPVAVPDTRQVLPGAFALPGLVDAHLHLAWLGRIDEHVDLSDARSAAEISARVTAFAAAHPHLKVIQGNGWDETTWSPSSPSHPIQLPRASDLGNLPVPVILSRVDGHAVWLNRAALTQALSLLTTVPQGTRIVTDNGGPTGVIVDPPPIFWERLIPAPTANDLERWLTAGMAKAKSRGLVEVHDMATSPAELAALTRLARLATPSLPIRVIVYLDDSDASFAYLEAHPEGPHAITPDLWVAGIKLFADGALGSRGAALKDDYSDEHGHKGQLNDPVALANKAIRAARLGYPIAIHAIGDRANLVALTAIAEAQSKANNPALVSRIEHAQVLDLADLDRFVQTRTIASMQPIHAMSDMRWAEARVGPERIKGAYAWNTILHRGIALAFGSDAPVEPVDPMLGLHAAITRQTAAGDPPGGWRPSEALPLPAALHAFTAGAIAAAPLNDHTRTGLLTVGSRFEVTLLDRDPRTSSFAVSRVVATHRAR